jgi:hypothetical protein
MRNVAIHLPIKEINIRSVVTVHKFLLDQKIDSSKSARAAEHNTGLSNYKLIRPTIPYHYRNLEDLREMRIIPNRNAEQS